MKKLIWNTMTGLKTDNEKSLFRSGRRTEETASCGETLQRQFGRQFIYEKRGFFPSLKGMEG